MEKFEYALPLNMLIGSIFRQIRIANRLDQGDVAQVTTLLPSTAETMHFQKWDLIHLQVKS